MGEGVRWGRGGQTSLARITSKSQVSVAIQPDDRKGNAVWCSCTRILARRMMNYSHMRMYGWPSTLSDRGWHKSTQEISHEGKVPNRLNDILRLKFVKIL